MNDDEREAELAFYSLPPEMKNKTVIYFNGNKTYITKDKKKMNEKEFSEWAKAKLEKKEDFFIIQKKFYIKQG